LLHITWTK